MSIIEEGDAATVTQPTTAPSPRPAMVPGRLLATPIICTSPPLSTHCRRQPITTAFGSLLRRDISSVRIGFLEALKCGWTLEELFGVDALAPLERPEQWGLVVGLALAPKPGDVIEHLDAEHAVIRYRVGSPLKEARRIERRFVPADSSVPWWKCSALVSDAEWFTQLSEPC